ncbi:MAG TPA: hypothetical protein VMV78_13545 [Thiobacillus sp.]|jgi:hypothetical protein|nr:hypothetical protein [Thiobacillus sp.]
MRFLFIQFISFACMLFVMAAQAGPDTQTAVNVERGTPTSVAASHSSDAAGVEDSDGNTGVKKVVRGGSRYGIGFEARQGIGSDVQGNRGGRDGRAKRGSQGR